MNTKMLLTLSALALAAATATTRADDIDAQFAALQARVAQLDAGRAADSSALKDRIRINGFLSAGAGWADAPRGFVYDTGLDNRASFSPDSVVGLQFDAKVADDVHAVTQLVAHGNENFGVEGEWAYVGYLPTENDEFRFGRQRASFYLLSEYLNVGYAYPWARPPVEVYKQSFPSYFDGLAWRHKEDIGGWQHDVYVNWGATESPPGSTTHVQADNAAAVGILSSHGDWTVSLNLSRAMLTADNPLFTALAQLGLIPPVKNDAIQFRALGVQYDNGKVVAIAEGTQTRIDGVISDDNSSYLTLGYRFGKVMPHITWASSRTADKAMRPANPYLSNQDDAFGNADGLPDLCPLVNPDPNASLCLAVVPNQTPLPGATMGIPFPADTLARMLNGDQDSVTLGVRYDFLPNVDLKFEWSRVLSTHGTFGLFRATDGNFFYDASGALLAKPDDNIDVFRVVVDATF